MLQQGYGGGTGVLITKRQLLVISKDRLITDKPIKKFLRCTIIFGWCDQLKNV